MGTHALEKFGFDTIFDGEGDVAYAAPRPKRSFSPEEVEVLEREAMREGERQTLARMEALQAHALASIAQDAKLALDTLAQVAHRHRVGSADLVLACSRAIADAALEAGDC